jgi:hypothetical protein
VLSALKAACTECRNSSLDQTLYARPAERKRNLLVRSLHGVLKSVGTSRSGLLQLSYIARALPEGGPRECDKALAKHQEALTSEHSTPPDLLARARLFAKSWYGQFGKETDFDPLMEGSSSGGAALGYKRSEGGRTLAAATREWLLKRSSTGGLCWFDQSTQSEEPLSWEEEDLLEILP